MLIHKVFPFNIKLNIYLSNKGSLCKSLENVYLQNTSERTSKTLNVFLKVEERSKNPEIYIFESGNNMCNLRIFVFRDDNQLLCKHFWIYSKN